MSRRVSKPVVALFALVLCLSAPTAFAAQRDGGGPDFGTRIVKMLRSWVKHFTPSINMDLPAPPKP